MVVPHGLEVLVVHRVLRCDSLRVVVHQHHAQQVEGLFADKLIVLRVNKFGPWLARDRVLGQQVVIDLVELQVVLVQVCVEFFCAEHFGNLDELIVIVATLEEWFALEDHASEHAAKRPDIERIVVSLHVDEQLGSLEVPRSNAHVVLLAGVVEFGQAPVNESKLAVGVVDHNVVRLDIPVHDALRMAEIKRLEDLVHVVANVKVVEALVELAEVSVARVDELSDNGRRLGQRVAHDIDQVDDVDSALERLQNFDLPPNLVLLDCHSIKHSQSRVRLSRGVEVVSALAEAGALTYLA